MSLIAIVIAKFAGLLSLVTQLKVHHLRDERAGCFHDEVAVELSTVLYWPEMKSLLRQSRPPQKKAECPENLKGRQPEILSALFYPKKII